MSTPDIKVIKNLSGRDVTLTLRAGRIEQGEGRAQPSVKVTMGPANDKQPGQPLVGRAESQIILRDVCARYGLDHAEISKSLKAGKFLDQMVAQNILAVV